MFVGVLRLVLHVPGAHSLKDKRQVVRSFKDRVRTRLGLSVAEVGDSERHQAATLAVVAVSGESSGVYEQLASARNLAANLSEALLSDAREVVLPFGVDGLSLLEQEPFSFSSRGQDAG
jgi:uncharacterized protein YlxP (DUF503 family)